MEEGSRRILELELTNNNMESSCDRITAAKGSTGNSVSGTY